MSTRQRSGAITAPLGRLAGQAADMFARARAAMARPVAQLLLLVIVSRLLLLACGSIAVVAQANPDVEVLPPGQPSLSQILRPFSYADVAWYTELATNGYEQRPYSDAEKGNWAFYPLWPLILHACNILFAEMVLPGMVLSSGLFALAALLLFQLLSQDGDEAIAFTASTLMITFPSAYFTLRPGPEALFIALVVGALLSARRRHWLIAGLLTALAALTRMQGAFLLPALLVIYYRQYQETRQHAPAVLALGLAPLAMGLLMLHMYQLTGNPLAHFATQRAWGNRLVPPFAQVIGFLHNPSILGYYGWDLVPISVAAICAAALGVALMARDRTMPAEYTIYTALSLLVIVMRDNSNGTLRYLLPMFPLFLLTARLIHAGRLPRTLVLYSFAALQMFFFVAYMQLYRWAQT